MNKDMNIGERLTDLMLDKEIDCKTLADAIGVNVTTTRRWKRNAKSMHLSQILKLANYFNCSLDFLTGRSDTFLDFALQECPPFYEHFRKILSDRGISRNKVNKETSIKSAHFVDWNKGSDPHILSLVELANYLDVTLDFLIGREK